MQIKLDECFQFGLGLFETIAIEKSQPVFLDWHLQRLQSSMEELGIHQIISREAVETFLEKASKKEELSHRALKIMVSSQNLVFSFRDNHYDLNKSFEKGLIADYSHVIRNDTSPLVRHKTMNYGDCILEKRRAGSLGLDELIFRNTKNEISEGTVSNIFFVKAGKVYTPAVECGLLPGVMRRFVLETCARMNIPCQECSIDTETAADMDECFVTNSLMGILPLNRLGMHDYTDRTLTGLVRDQYLKEISRIG